MNKTLLDNNYLVIPNFLPQDRAKNLSEEFKEYSKLNPKSGDPQVPNAYAAYNYISFLELLCEKTYDISKSIGETVLPTYSYARIYGNQCDLKPHIDRESCEVSLTVHLDGDEPWHIWIETPSGDEKGVLLNPGDAMVYFGTMSRHWRNPYQGNYYTQLFLHYVRSRGKYVNHYFDKEKTQNVLGADNPTKIKDLANSNEEDSSTNLESIIEELPEKPEEKTKISSPAISVGGTTKLEDFILTFDDIVPLDLCDRIISEYETSFDWTKTAVGDNNYLPEVRSCDMINISTQDIINKNIEIRKKIDEELFVCANTCLLKYKERFSTIGADTDTGYDLLRYKEGQHYSQHTDSFRLQQRSLTCSLLLNDDYEGGEFAFFNREIMIKGGKGGAIIFPSNFMYPHEIMKVISGVRYSIVTWYV
jgi:hypothetical protein